MRFFILSFLIYAATFALYSPSWRNEFVLDDLTKIQENSDLRTPFELRNFVYPYSDQTMRFRNDPSRPLTYILYWACWHAGDGQVWPFHALNTLLHATAAALLAVLTLQLTLFFFGESSYTAAALAAAFFVSSPLLAGTVIYPFGLSDILCAVFSLAMLTTLAQTQRPSRLRMICAVTLYYLALSSKQAALIAPALVVAVDYFTNKAKNPWRILHIYTPLFSMSAIYLAIRFLYFGGIGDLEGLNETIPAPDYFATQGLMILKYLWHTFVPAGLTIDHQIFPDELKPWTEWAAWALIAALSAGALVTRWRKSRTAKILAFAWCFFLMALLPTSSILPTVDLFVERRAYFADAGLFLALGIFLWRLSRHRIGRPLVLSLAAVAVSAQAAASRSRIDVYKDPERLWKESWEAQPRNTRAMINLAVYYSKIERWQESREILERLLELRPDNGSIYSKLAYIYHQPGYAGRDDDKAWRLYEKSLELMPNNIFALYNMGIFKMEKGDDKTAIEYFLKAAQFSPRMTKAWEAAGQAAFKMGDKERAAAFFSEALKIDPTLPTSQVYLRRLRSNR